MQILDTVYPVGYIYLVPVSIASGKLQLRNLASTQIINEYFVYMIVEHCHSNHLIPIIALYVYQKPRYILFSMYTALFFRNFPVNSKGLVNTLKTKVK